MRESYQMGSNNQRKITLTDIAGVSGMSIATISRFLNGKSVRKYAENRIRDAMNELGVENILNRREAVYPGSVQSSQIGVIVPDIKHNYCSKIVSGVLKRAMDYGQQVIVASSDSLLNRERAILVSFSKIKLAGLIYVPIGSWDAVVPGEISLFDHIPVVVVGRRNVLKNRCHVYSDNITGGYLATKYLINLNRKRIVFCVGTWDNSIQYLDPYELVTEHPEKAGIYGSLDRFIGYLKALEEEGISYDSQLIATVTWDFQGGCNAVAKILGRTRDFDSFITTSDTMASGVLDTLKKHGYCVPEQVSIVGWDNSELTMFTEPHLTSMFQDSERMGAVAVDCIKSTSRGALQDVVLDSFLYPRGTTTTKVVI